MDTVETLFQIWKLQARFRVKPMNKQTLTITEFTRLDQKTTGDWRSYFNPSVITFYASLYISMSEYYLQESGCLVHELEKTSGLTLNTSETVLFTQVKGILLWKNMTLPHPLSPPFYSSFLTSKALLVRGERGGFGTVLPQRGGWRLQCCLAAPGSPIRKVNCRMWPCKDTNHFHEKS